MTMTNPVQFDASSKMPSSGSTVDLTGIQSMTVAAKYSCINEVNLNKLDVMSHL